MYLLKIIALQCVWLVSGDKALPAMNIKKMMKTETALIDLLDSYVRSSEEELRRLKGMVLELKNDAGLELSPSTPESVLQFIITRRLLREWSKVRLLITNSAIKDKARQGWKKIERTMSYPSEADLGNAAAAIIRLQDTNTTSIAKEESPESKRFEELDAEDCFELGEYSYNKLSLSRSKQWLDEALARYRLANERDETIHHSDPKGSLKWKLYNYLPYLTLMEGKKEEAFNLTKEIVENTYPTHENVWGCQELIMKVVKMKNASAVEKWLPKSPLEMDDADSTTAKDSKFFPKELTDKFKALCRGESSMSVSVLSELKCRYVTTSPYTKLARLKEEEVHLNPRIVVFREVVYDSEIETLKKMATAKMERGVVANGLTGNVRTTSHRIVKQSSFNANDSEIVKKILRRAEDLTMLSTMSAEEFVVINYGLGGHVYLHYDQLVPYIPGVVPRWDGNRLTSLLFYLSDVDDGGATAFPALNLAVRPEKGSVVLWRDLLYNGESDNRVAHGACPVSKGSKWVVTLFLHTGGNELRAPCKLNEFE